MPNSTLNVLALKGMIGLTTTETYSHGVVQDHINLVRKRLDNHITRHNPPYASLEDGLGGPDPEGWIASLRKARADGAKLSRLYEITSNQEGDGSPTDGEGQELYDHLLQKCLPPPPETEWATRFSRMTQRWLDVVQWETRDIDPKEPNGVVAPSSHLLPT